LDIRTPRRAMDGGDATLGPSRRRSLCHRLCPELVKSLSRKKTTPHACNPKTKIQLSDNGVAPGHFDTRLQLLQDLSLLIIGKIRIDPKLVIIYVLLNLKRKEKFGM